MHREIDPKSLRLGRTPKRTLVLITTNVVIFLIKNVLYVKHSIAINYHKN